MDALLAAQVRHAYESGYENVVIFEDDVNVMPRIAHQKGFDNAMEEVMCPSSMLLPPTSSLLPGTHPSLSGCEALV